MPRTPLSVQTVGSHLLPVDSCPSTNDYLRELVQRKTVAPGTVVYTFQQTQGKGQRGNMWTDMAGQSLAMSVWLQPNMPVSEAFVLNKAVALAVCEALRAYSGLDFYLKWPNDILFQGKKVCGILIENTIHQQKVTQCLAGIGVNLNQQSFPPHLAQAISLRQATGHVVDGETILEAICVRLDDWWWQWQAGRARTIHTHYDKWLYDKGVMKLWTDGKVTDWGCLHGVDTEGNAVVYRQGQVAAWPHGSLKAL